MPMPMPCLMTCRPLDMGATYWHEGVLAADHLSQLRSSSQQITNDCFQMVARPAGNLCATCLSASVSEIILAGTTGSPVCYQASSPGLYRCGTACALPKELCGGWVQVQQRLLRQRASRNPMLLKKTMMNVSSARTSLPQPPSSLAATM